MIASGADVTYQNCRDENMPLLDHFHPPLHGLRRWEGLLHSRVTLIARQLNMEPLAVMPLWLSLELCVPVRLEDRYLETCRSLRISA